MRLSSASFLALTFGCAAAASLVAASVAVGVVERKTAAEVRRNLVVDGQNWAQVSADGLQVQIAGTAPNEAMRFRAKSVAGTVVDASRVIDRMDVTQRTAIDAPDFSIEILRNEGEVSLIGLVPQSFDRVALVERLEGLPGVTSVSDLLQTADFPAPREWDDSVAYSVDALRRLPHSKISMRAGDVGITAMSPSPEAKRRLEDELRSAARDGRPSVRLDISAPRPIIAPFTLRFVKDADGARFDACSVDTEAGRGRILQAARDAGMDGSSRCVIGLGVPSSDWSRAVAMSIAAVDQLGGGSVTFTDADISLLAPEGTRQSVYDRVVGELENDLPQVYALEAVLPARPETPDEDEAPEFTATLSPEGMVQLRGRVTDAMTREAARSLARARFGSENVYFAARLDEDLPEDWPTRVLTALDALAQLTNGSATVTQDRIALSGDTHDEEASTRIAQLFGDRLGTGDYDIQIAYHPQIDPIDLLPTPMECVDLLTAIQSDGAKIGFEPGSANVTLESRALIDQMAEVLRECPQIPLEIAGYTDSQGRDEMNQNLSQSRAQAVLNELRIRRVLTGTFEARGYGEADPIADNGTEEGREANRRIEFRLQPEALAEIEAAEAEAQALAAAEAQDAAAQDDSEAEGETGTDTDADADAAPDDAAAATDTAQTDDSAAADATDGDTADAADETAGATAPEADPAGDQSPEQDGTQQADEDADQGAEDAEPAPVYTGPEITRILPVPRPEADEND